MNQQARVFKQESLADGHHHHLFCFKSVFAGVFTALICFIALSALGAGIAGLSAEGMTSTTPDSSGAAVATMGGLWIGLSIVISLFIGSYLALRISRFQTAAVGAAHGVVILAIFFLTVLAGVGKVVGGLAQGMGHVIESAGQGAGGLASSPFVQDTINKSLGDTKLKADPKEVAQGLAVRLLQGDQQSAKSYYAYQSGQTEAQVDAKVTQLKADFDTAIKRVEDTTARAAKDAGFSIFMFIVAGLTAALLGGIVGADANEEKPFAKSTKTNSGLNVLRTENGSVAPYIFGWLLGVPVSILFLIAMLRTIF